MSYSKVSLEAIVSTVVIDFGAIVDPAAELVVDVPTAAGVQTVTVPALATRTATALADAFIAAAAPVVRVGDVAVYHGEGSTASAVTGVTNDVVTVVKEAGLADNKPAMLTGVLGVLAGRTI